MATAAKELGLWLESHQVPYALIGGLALSWMKSYRPDPKCGGLLLSSQPAA
jgi:hypothetical protein